ncbi:hypothetical protein I4F81_003884 [Pyropia yezoensis]|uniref:Uncharacterized protein n=1 Tax=Pyropia yezoensis TaxID=2788 RepID=A0ACC3BTL0_PYRYE|nr:hypothetical protein I4F81_003884 [Neopyropia yezoensis]
MTRAVAAGREKRGGGGGGGARRRVGLVKGAAAAVAATATATVTTTTAAAAAAAAATGHRVQPRVKTAATAAGVMTTAARVRQRVCRRVGVSRRWGHGAATPPTAPVASARQYTVLPRRRLPTLRVLKKLYAVAPLQRPRRRSTRRQPRRRIDRHACAGMDEGPRGDRPVFPPLPAWWPTPDARRSRDGVLARAPRPAGAGGGTPGGGLVPQEGATVACGAYWRRRPPSWTSLCGASSTTRARPRGGNTVRGEWRRWSRLVLDAPRLARQKLVDVPALATVCTTHW